jgi:hypothetical protein
MRRKNKGLLEEGGFNEVCRMFLMIMLFIFTISYLFECIDPTMAYFNAQVNRAGLLEGFHNVTDKESLVYFLDNQVKDKFFNSGSSLRLENYTDETTMVLLNHGWQDTLLVGEVCLIQHRAPYTDCPDTSSDLELQCQPNYLLPENYDKSTIRTNDG